jgi:hypothetical protein
MIENFLEFHGCFPALTRLQVRLTAHIGGIESSELGNVGMNQKCVAWEAGKLFYSWLTNGLATPPWVPFFSTCSDTWR